VRFAILSIILPFVPPPIQIVNIMLSRRIIDRIRHQDWSALIGELIIVVVGIFIAIQVDRWWKHQDDLQQEQVYITRLTEDLERDVESIGRAIALAEHRYALSNLMIAAAVDPEVVRQQPAAFMTAIPRAAGACSNNSVPSAIGSRTRETRLDRTLRRFGINRSKPGCWRFSIPTRRSRRRLWATRRQ
jgi:hypothetical protein